MAFPFKALAFVEASGVGLDVDRIEHVLQPELGRRLEAMLSYPALDRVQELYSADSFGELIH
jgi:hypothetical protein